jgi:hypothetical protein
MINYTKKMNNKILKALLLQSFVQLKVVRVQTSSQETKGS